MKKHILGLTMIAALAGSISMGCSSAKKTGGADSTSMSDSSAIKAPMDTAAGATDTSQSKMADTSKKDTIKKP